MNEVGLATMASWLLNHIEWLRHHRAGHEAVEEITAAVWEVARVIDRPPEREYVGPCRDCGADIYGKPGAAVAECRPCGVGYDVAEMREWMKAQIYGRLVTAREGSALLCRFGLETKQATIDTWVHRKRLVPRGHDTEGRRMYLFDDLVTIAARSQAPDTPNAVRVAG